MSLCRLLSIAGLVLVLAGCAGHPSAAKLSPASAMASLDDTYQLGPSDRIRVKVWRNPELSVNVPVRPDGMISVPLIGDVRAGGRSPEAVAAAVERKLSKYIREPHVTVIVTELNSDAYLSRVRVTGAVEQPVSIPWQQGMTVLDLVLEAGGPTEFADLDDVTLYRRVNGETRAYQVHLGEILSGGDLSTNVVLRPGDVVSVPQSLF